jgi:hypothetical protein
MARRSGLVVAISQIQRDAERRRAAALREQQAAVRVAAQAQRAYERSMAASEKERQRLYVVFSGPITYPHVMSQGREGVRAPRRRWLTRPDPRRKLVDLHSQLVSSREGPGLHHEASRCSTPASFSTRVVSTVSWA